MSASTFIFCPLTPLKEPSAHRRVISRIFIREDGDLVVTDLWEEVRELLEGPDEKTGKGKENEMDSSL